MDNPAAKLRSSQVLVFGAAWPCLGAKGKRKCFCRTLTSCQVLTRSGVVVQQVEGSVLKAARSSGFPAGSPPQTVVGSLSHTDIQLKPSVAADLSKFDHRRGSCPEKQGMLGG